MLAQLCACGPKRTIGSYQFLSHVDLLASMGVVVKVWHPERKVTGSLNSNGGSWRGERRCCCVICYVRTGQYVSLKEARKKEWHEKAFFSMDKMFLLVSWLARVKVELQNDLIWLVDVVQWWTSTVHLIIWQLWHESASPFSQKVFKNSFPDGLVQQTMWWVTLEPSIRIV